MAAAARAAEEETLQLERRWQQHGCWQARHRRRKGRKMAADQKSLPLVCTRLDGVSCVPANDRREAGPRNVHHGQGGVPIGPEKEAHRKLSASETDEQVGSAPAECLSLPAALTKLEACLRPAEQSLLQMLRAIWAEVLVLERKALSVLKAFRSATGRRDAGISSRKGYGGEASSRDWIINGREAKPNSRPYMAALYGGLETTRFVCDGFLIREDFVLTAAHCKEKSMIVKLGVHRLSKPMKAWQVIKVKEVFTHPKYTLKPMRNDIMLLKLASPAKLNQNVSLLALAERKDKDERTGMSCFILGWGTNETGGSPSDVLMEADISITDQKKCIEIWSKDLVTANMICARGARNQGICQVSQLLLQFSDPELEVLDQLASLADVALIDNWLFQTII
ncbi:MCPT3 protease, partial [Polypterus senegalus]